MGVFYRNYVRKNRVLIFWIKNKHCKTKKMTFYQGPKNEHFLKRLVVGFCAKIEISLIAFFFRNDVHKNRFSIFWIKKIILDPKIEVLTRAKKCTFF